MFDAYTTSSKYPYSQYSDGVGGLGGRLNYARNSVKATVDAYNGTVKFYVVDPDDPIIKSWQQSFPDLFSTFDEMPEALKDHLRYPEDLFRVQSDIFAKYHVIGTRRFFQGSEQWLISPDPNEAISAASLLQAPVTGDASSSGRSPEIRATSKRQDPYYLYIRLPGDERESFLMLQSFVPISQNNQQLRLVSFLTAKSDRRNYGQLESFVMPQGLTVDGPVQAALQINQNAEISARFTLLNQQQSRIIRGNVQLIPVGNSIVYVQPIFIEGEGASRFPIYQFVAVFAQGRDPVLAPTVNEALVALFPEDRERCAGNAHPGDHHHAGHARGSRTRCSICSIRRPRSSTTPTRRCRASDLARYATLVKEAQDLVAKAQAQLNADGTGTAGRRRPPRRREAPRPPAPRAPGRAPRWAPNSRERLETLSAACPIALLGAVENCYYRRSVNTRRDPARRRLAWHLGKWTPAKVTPHGRQRH